MKYTSTRGSYKGIGSANAIVKGLCEDGGLFVPQEIPQLEIHSCLNLNYQELAFKVLSLFLTDYPQEVLQNCINEAYTDAAFESKLANIVSLNDKLFSLELWHGPTCAFKDYALQLMPRLLVSAKKIINSKEITKILVATSGDTGKAALDGYSDLEGVKIAVFYPNKGTSEIQRLQMATQKGENVSVYAVDGNFDDCQTGVKLAFNDKDLAREIKCKGEALSSANSINWGRLAPQIVYYISTYCTLVNDGKIRMGDKINFCVPTGNFGDILAGYYAKKMGLPIGKLICASNKNNVLYDFIKTGVYTAKREFYKTTSPSMDILISSNLERFLYHLCEDSQEINGLMTELNTNGHFTVSTALHQKITNELTCGFVNDENVSKTIKNVYDNYNYLIDTHTAVAFCVAQELTQDMNVPCVIVSTASPFKFSESVLEALGGKAQKNEFETISALEKLAEQAAPKNLTELKNKSVRFDEIIEKGEIRDKALNM